MIPIGTDLVGAHLLVVGTWDMRQAALDSWTRAGIEVTLVDHSATKRPGPAARRIDMDVWDSAAPSSAELADLAATADGVVTLAEFCAVTAANVAEAAGLPGPSVHAARIARDKVALRRRLAGAGIPGPRFAAVSSEADVVAFFAQGVTDAVLKPSDSAGSTAVFRVRSAEEATAALPRTLRWSFSGRAIIEEFVSGPEFSVEAGVQAGITQIAAIVEKATIPHCFVEYRHVTPGDPSGAEAAALRAATARVVSALGVRDAVIHAEFRLSAGRFVPIEIAVRPAGGLIPDLLELANGTDLYRAQAALALGVAPEPIGAREAGFAGVQFVTGTGTVEDDVRIDDLLHDHPDLERAGQLVPNGSAIGELDTNGARAGYVMARSEDRETLDRLLDAASGDLERRMGLVRRRSQL